MMPVATRAALLAAVLTTACATGMGSTARPPAPPPAPVVAVAMVDHGFELDDVVPSGRVVFRIANEGRSPHNLILIPLPDDVPPILEQLAGSERRLVEPFAGVYDRAPGEGGTFAVDLVPGQRYAMVCSLATAEGEPHWRKGMATEFRAGARPAR